MNFLSNSCSEMSRSFNFASLAPGNKRWRMAETGDLSKCKRKEGNTWESSLDVIQGHTLTELKLLKDARGFMNIIRDSMRVLTDRLRIRSFAAATPNPNFNHLSVITIAGTYARALESDCRSSNSCQDRKSFDRVSLNRSRYHQWSFIVVNVARKPLENEQR